MLRHMTLAEMTVVSGQMVDKTTRRDTFLSIPEVAPLHTLLTDAHNAVLGAQPTDAQPSPEMVAILQEEAEARRSARSPGARLDAHAGDRARALPRRRRARRGPRRHVRPREQPDLPGRTGLHQRLVGCGSRQHGARGEAAEGSAADRAFPDTIEVPGKKAGNKNGASTKKTLLDTVNERIERRARPPEGGGDPRGSDREAGGPGGAEDDPGGLARNGSRS